MTANATYIAQWAPATDTAYTVKHYQQNVDNDDYTLVLTESKEGTTGEQTAAQVQTYTGFTAKDFEQKTIAADGSTVVEIYYDRYTYTVTYTDGVEDEEVFEDQVNSGVRYGAATPAFRGTPTRTGYVFAGWKDADGNAPATTVTANATYYAQWEVDVIGTTDPDEPDGVPDKYQATVTYRVNNDEYGRVSLTKAVVTLYDGEEYSETGTGYLSEAQIATATAKEGYKADKPLWDTEPTTELAITRDITLTATFIPQVASLSVDKTTNAVGQQDIGSKIDYTIKVTNNGDVTLTNVVVTDELTGNTGDKAWMIESLAPGAEVTVTSETNKAVYTVTKGDVHRTSGKVNAQNELVNTAVATASNPLVEGATITRTGTASNEIAYRNVTVQKNIINPQNVYDFGDVIQYSITVINNGNVTEDDLTITDRLLNATGNVTGEGWTNGVYNVPVLEPGQKHTAYCSYTVRAQDEGRVIRNNAAVMRNGDEVASSTTGGAQVINLYNLAIVYVDANTGYALAETYLAKLKAGTPFYVVSPIIEGYTTKVLAVKSDADGMPAHDLSIAVVYTPIAPEEEPEEEPKEPEVNVVTPTDDGGYDLTPISELDTPLANMDLGDHTCCIMHFLLMLASLITLAFYTDSRKKHQARIHQLRESLKAEGKNDPSEKM